MTINNNSARQSAVATVLAVVPATVSVFAGTVAMLGFVL